MPRFVRDERGGKGDREASDGGGRDGAVWRASEHLLLLSARCPRQAWRGSVLVLVYDYLSVCVCVRVCASASPATAPSCFFPRGDKREMGYTETCVSVCMCVCRIENLYVSN